LLTPSVYAKDLAVKKALNLLPRPAIIIDAGCSNGFHLQGIDADMKIGLDINPLLFNSDEHGIKCDIRSIPLKDNVANCIVSLDVIEHIIEHHRVISEFHRVLSDNGVLVLTTPNDSEFIPYKKIRRLFKIDTALMHQEWGHIRNGYTQNDLLGLIENYDFTLLSYHTIYKPFVQLMDFPYALLFAYLNNKPDSQQSIRNLKKNSLITILERIHDFLLKFLLAPSIPRIENREQGGFLHLVAFTKN
jgi:SAM-dependent methyltransferase